MPYVAVIVADKDLGFAEHFAVYLPKHYLNYLQIDGIYAASMCQIQPLFRHV